MFFIVNSILQHSKPLIIDSMKYKPSPISILLTRTLALTPPCSSKYWDTLPLLGNSQNLGLGFKSRGRERMCCDYYFITMFVLRNFLFVLSGTQKMTNETYGNKRMGGICLFHSASSEFDLYEYYLL